MVRKKIFKKNLPEPVSFAAIETMLSAEGVAKYLGVSIERLVRIRRSRSFPKGCQPENGGNPLFCFKESEIAEWKINNYREEE